MIFVLSLFAVITGSAAAADQWGYELLEDGTAIITAYSGTDSEVSIPDVLDGHVVSALAADVFRFNEELTSVEIPTGVTSIGARAFEDCQNLKKVVLPDGLIAIEDGAFKNCDALAEINLPGTVTHIAEDAFWV